MFKPHVVRFCDVLPLMRLARGGDPDARMVIEAINQWMRSRTRLCLNCDTRFLCETDPAAFMVVLPAADLGSAIVAGVCEGCAAGDLDEIVFRRMRELWPDLHVISGGNA